MCTNSCVHELGRIAYEGVFHREQVIFSNLPEGFETLGQMQCVPELYVDEGAAVSYNFLHLTVQEYLTAFHLSQQPVEKQTEHYESYEFIREKERKQETWCHFYMTLQFLSGITKFRGYPSETVDRCIQVEKPFKFDDESYSESADDSTSVVELDSDDDSASVVEFDSDDSNTESDDDSTRVLIVNCNTLQRLFEVQDSDIIAKLLWSSNVQLSAESDIVTPFDCFVLGYCISHSNCIWTFDFWSKEGHIGDEGVEMLIRGAVEEETHCTGGISRIGLRKNGITSEGVKHLSTSPNQMLNKLEELYLSDNNLDSESCPALAQLIPCAPHLKRLELSNNPNIGQGVAVSLITSMTVHDSLEMLYLDKTGIGVEDCQVLSELLLSSASLKKLDISGNNLPLEAVELIVSGLLHNNTLEYLSMNNSQFSPQHTISLASLLRTNDTLVRLNLRECNIDSDGACQLANALCANDTLQTLNLSGNPTGVKGATAFAEMLWTNRTLVDLNLSQCSIDSDGACQLANALHTNDTLKELYLEDNPIGLNGASSFAEMLIKNKSLKLLDIPSNSIGKSGTVILIDSLRQNTTLERLVLPVLHVVDIITESGTTPDIVNRVTSNPHYLIVLKVLMDKINELT